MDRKPGQPRADDASRGLLVLTTLIVLWTALRLVWG
jgi:hypothetical protein